jgi:hypothetical protein
MYARFQERHIEELELTLAGVAHHIGGTPGLPWTIVQAAESARTRLCQFLGHQDIPRDADGRPVAFNEVGR